MYKIITAISIMLFACWNPAQAKEWCAIAHGQAIKMSEISCIVASDGSAQLALLLADGKVVGEIDRLTFDYIDAPGAGIESAIIDSEFAIKGNKITISNLHAASGSEVEIYNIAGQLMTSHRAKATDFEVDLSALCPGMYIIKINGKSFKFKRQ